jgi:subtilase family serine protease
MIKKINIIHKELIKIIQLNINILLKKNPIPSHLIKKSTNKTISLKVFHYLINNKNSIGLIHSNHPSQTPLNNQITTSLSEKQKKTLTQNGIITTI